MNCHSCSPGNLLATGGSIALVGQPNVGKSVFFSKLTGQRVVISNYPGTTVEVARGALRDLPGMTLVDTPGVITFPPASDDEFVTEKVLLGEDSLRAVLQVGDIKNLRRTLGLTVQLAEMELPMALALNMADEAAARGVVTDVDIISEALSIPVVSTTAVSGRGVDEVRQAIETASPPAFQINYAPVIEQALENICALIPPAPVAPRALALLWLCGDPVSEDWLRSHLSPGAYQEITTMRKQAESDSPEPLTALIQTRRLEFVEMLASRALIKDGSDWQGFSSRLGSLTTHPVWGLGILAIVLLGLYEFVGVFGAGTMVGILEKGLFGQVINPAVTAFVTRVLPAPLLSELLVGKYGMWTMGITYALALILPIVTTFFLAFSVMEDSGYLPRLAALSNRLFQMIGLNGKAVLPMVLGLGCVTMATLTTRVMETKRERILVTLLLALAIPCSAQLGVVMGMLAGVSFAAALIWGGVVLLILLSVGWLAAQLMPGERSQLLVELPPLRFPQISNVILKTLARLEWYLKEVVPLFLFGALLLFSLDKTGILDWLTHLGQPLVTGWLGLPPQASAAFLIGFVRRDFGATGLFIMQSQGLLSPAQVVTAMVTITLFIPCVASLMMIAKERGWKNAIAMFVLIMPLAFLAGGLVNRLLLVAGWS